MVDIYIGGKRDKSGSIVAFVRFKDVRDVKRLEKEMCRVRWEHCILKVNIAKYQKQSNLRGDTQKQMKSNIPTPKPNTLHMQSKVRGYWGTKTFADVVAGQKIKTPVPLTCPVISLNPSKKTLNWDDAQQIANIPTIMRIDGNDSGMVYYVGGLRILINFICKKNADAFSRFCKTTAKLHCGCGIEGIQSGR